MGSGKLLADGADQKRSLYMFAYWKLLTWHDSILNYGGHKKSLQVDKNNIDCVTIQ